MNTNEEQSVPLKPIVFIKGQYDFHRNNLFQQNLLLKALQVTSDPVKLRQMIGVQKVADVYRTLDKLALRKEYHQALTDLGIDFNTIVTGIKQIAEGGIKDADRLAAWKVFLRSLGLDEYKEESADSKKTWEDLVKDVSEKELESGKKDLKFLEYEVNEPAIPEDEKEKIEEEKKVGKSLYEQ
jgi:hypothetical protein